MTRWTWRNAPGTGARRKALALDKVEELGADRTVVQSLPLGSFIAWNRLTHGWLAGKVF